MIKEIAQQLDRFDLFKDIPKEQLSDMMVCLQPQKVVFHKNEFLCIEGDEFTGIGLLVEGRASITKETVTGERHMLATLNTGEIFGEMAAFHGNNRWPATVVASEPCTVLFLPKKTFFGGCANNCSGHSKMIENMLGILALKAQQLNKKVEYLTIRSLRGKIARYLLENHKKSGMLTFNIPLGRNELAEFFNVSRPSLSREMCRMRDDGIFDVYKSSIKILDLQKLKDADE